MSDKYEEIDIYAELGSKINSGEIIREGAFKDYIRELKKHKTAIMETDLITNKVESLCFLNIQFLNFADEVNRFGLAICTCLSFTPTPIHVFNSIYEASLNAFTFISL